MEEQTEPKAMKSKLLIPKVKVGIVGYGAYVPRYRLPAQEIGRIWGSEGGFPVKEKAVAGLDEDVITMSIEAARNALKRAGIPAQELRAVWVGSESHPYAVKPSGTVVAEAIGASNDIQSGDWEFACKAGSEAMVAAMALVGSGMGDYALAIGMDTAQGKPGDALEFTAARAARLLLSVPSAPLWRISKQTVLSPTRPISGAGNIRFIRSMGSGLRASRRILSMSAIRQEPSCRRPA